MHQQLSLGTIIQHGNVEPSDADKYITKRLKEACELMDIKLLDHFIVSGSASFCFTDNHLI